MPESFVVHRLPKNGVHSEACQHTRYAVRLCWNLSGVANSGLSRKKWLLRRSTSSRWSDQGPQRCSGPEPACCSSQAQAFGRIRFQWNSSVRRQAFSR